MKIAFASLGFFALSCITVNSIWGGVPPPNRKKIREKNSKCNEDDF